MRNIFSIICLNRKIIFYHLMSSLKCFVSVMVFPVAGPPGSLYLPAPSALNTRSELCTQQIAFSFGKQVICPSILSKHVRTLQLFALKSHDKRHSSSDSVSQQTTNKTRFRHWFFYWKHFNHSSQRNKKTFITREERNRLFSKEGIFTTPERGNKVTLTECGLD